MFNVFIILAMLVRFFVFDEPTPAPGSKTKFWRLKRQVQADIEEGEDEKAVKHLKEAAICLGRPTPQTFLDSVSSIFWHLLVLILHKLKLPNLVRYIMRADKKYVFVFHSLFFLSMILSFIQTLDRITKVKSIIKNMLAIDLMIFMTLFFLPHSKLILELIS